MDPSPFQDSLQPRCPCLGRVRTLQTWPWRWYCPLDLGMLVQVTLWCVCHWGYLNLLDLIRWKDTDDEDFEKRQNDSLDMFDEFEWLEVQFACSTIIEKKMAQSYLLVSANHLFIVAPQRTPTMRTHGCRAPQKVLLSLNLLRTWGQLRIERDFSIGNQP